MISRYSLFVVVVLCLLQTTLVVAVFPGGRYRFNDEASFQRTQDTPCECMLVQAHALYLNSSQAKPDITGGWRCVIKEAIYEFQDGLPNGLIEKLQSEDSTKATMQISSCNIVVNNDEVSTRTELFGRSSVVPDVGGNRIKIDPNATITVTRNNNERRRSLQGGTPLPDDPTGKHVTVVVRVSGNDVAPAKSAAEIADDFFTDPMNLVRSPWSCVMLEPLDVLTRLLVLTSLILFDNPATTTSSSSSTTISSIHYFNRDLNIKLVRETRLTLFPLPGKALSMALWKFHLTRIWMARHKQQSPGGPLTSFSTSLERTIHMYTLCTACQRKLTLVQPPPLDMLDGR